jgi:two-component system cell cycle sensor histidine kinase PleC
MIVDQNGIVTFASPSMRKLLGMDAGSAEETINLRNVIDFVSPEDALDDRPFFGLGFGMGARGNSETSGDAWTQSILSGEHTVLSLMVKSKKQISLRFDRIDLPENRSVLVASSTEDAASPEALADFVKSLTSSPTPITPEKTTDKTSGTVDAADTWNGLLGNFVAMGHDFMVLLSARGKILHANDVFYNALDLTAGDVHKKSFLDLLHGDDRPYVQPIFKNLMQESGAESPLAMIAFECRLLGKNKKICWLDCRVKKQGEHVMLVCRDLTDGKRNELELIRRQQQLSEAQSIGHMGHWIWRIGDEQLEFSDEIYRIFGVSPEHFLPTIDSVNNVMHRRDRGRMAQAFQRAMIERKNYEMEFRVIRSDGDVRFIQLQGRCELDHDGDVSALFGIMQDITERTQHERELKDAVEDAERAYAAKSQFLANMSHELRTPLNAIIGFSEMIGRQMLGPIGTPKYLEYINGIRESGEHLLDLITDILDMSKIEAGKYTLDVEDFNLFKVLRLATHMIEGRALDAQVKVTNDIPESGDLHIVGDRRAIMQMVLNLLSNAVKFTEPGGNVRVTCNTENNQVMIVVADTGIGIPAHKLRYVTKPFEQAANQFTRNHEGSGLGLAITKELAELHGGSLTLASTEGVGTQVTVTLPMKAVV